MRDTTGAADTAIRSGAGTAEPHHDYLDGWRGIAIILVLVAHFSGITWLNFGRLGVDTFFALSGLLMCQLLYERRTPLGTFYWRRASRILPAFLVYAGAIFALQSAAQWDFSAKEFLATVTFLRTYFGGDIWSASAPIGHLWSLNVEEHTYVIMTALTLISFLRGREGLGLALLSFACVCTWMVYIKLGKPSGYELRTECAAVFIMCSAAFARIKPHLNWKIPWICTAISVLAAAWCYSALAPWWAQFFPGLLLGFAVNQLGELPPNIRAVLSWKPLRKMGIWSFSIYLWQQPFHEWTKARGYAGVPALLFLAAAICISLISFYCIERPARAWINRLPRSNRPATKIASCPQAPVERAQVHPITSAIE